MLPVWVNTNAINLVSIKIASHFSVLHLAIINHRKFFPRLIIIQKDKFKIVKIARITLDVFYLIK